MRRQETWIHLADRIMLPRVEVVAVCCLLNIKMPHGEIARKLGIQESIVDAIAEYARPLLRASRPAREALDGRRCIYCGSAFDLSVDHVMPRSRGGSDAKANRVWACMNCNSSKGARTPREWLACR